MFRVRRFHRLVLLIWATGFSSIAIAAVTPAEREKIQELSQAIRQAGELYNSSKFADCASKVAEIQKELTQLLESKDPALQRMVQPHYSRLSRAHAMLELEGAELLALPTWEELTQSPDMKADVPSQAVSFTKDLAPWLVSACGNCHINNRRGQFSMATFESLMQGAGGNVVLFAGGSKGSRIVEVIESGDMPRGGGKVLPEQLSVLKNWIDQGAKFDGPNPAAPLTTLAAGTAPKSTAPAPTMKPADGTETVSFAKDIAPILLENCNGCHIAGQQASANFRMDTFAQLLRGGDSGEVITGSNANNSLLIKKLKGEVGDRMPAGGKPPLSDEAISLFSTWIREGARYDGPAANTSLQTVVDQAWAEAATHEVLFQKRQERALQRWSRVLPGDTPSIAKNDEIFVLGNIPPERLNTILKQLDEATGITKKSLQASSKTPLVKGGITVFILKSRYDYSEFGRMTESRELPKDWLGHWQADPMDVYAVLAGEKEIEEKQAEAIALQVITGAYLGSFREVPIWFAEGVARNLVVTNFRRGDERVSDWQRSLPAALQKVKDAKTLLENRLDEEAAGLVGMALTNFMMDRVNRRRFDKLLELLREGKSFTDSTTFAFAPPEAMVKVWLGK